MFPYRRSQGHSQRQGPPRPPGPGTPQRQGQPQPPGPGDARDPPARRGQGPHIAKDSHNHLGQARCPQSLVESVLTPKLKLDVCVYVPVQSSGTETSRPSRNQSSSTTSSTTSSTSSSST
ncbi:unnamed protein product [Pleuronectes platessa]|uniref:Uncharacterized protein n=1 Tax=Pleuronectes platessa TaxID=8262 RepID=A0A9N7Y8C5_PLEPL|nr:unnamed protein product [Pleuronectes platessa]